MRRRGASLSLSSLALGAVLTLACGGGGGPTPGTPTPTLQAGVTPGTLKAGETAVLTWNLPGATSIRLEGGFGDLAGNSAVYLAPTRTTRYTLKAVHPEGPKEATVEVTVTGTSTVRTDKQELLEDLRALSNPAMEGRLVGSEAGTRARTWLKDRLKTLGLDAQEQAWTSSGKSGVNLLATLKGTGGSARTVLVGAHYDHIGRGVAGADDNASGSVAVLQLVRYLKSHPPVHDVLFAWWDGEEAGLLGSEAFTRKPTLPLANLAYVMNLDMVSRADFGKLGVIGTNVWPGVRPYVDAAATAAGLVTDYGWEKYMPYSDQYVFHSLGVRTVFFCDVDHPDYHTVRDTYERIHPDFFAKVVEAALGTFLALDGMATLPPRVPGDTLFEAAVPRVPGGAWAELPWLTPEGRLM